MMAEYISKALGAWFLGFFPLAEIYIAVPAAVATGLDDLSVLVWTIFGNFTPVLLVTALYTQLIRIPRVRVWFEWLINEKAQERINKYGVWFVLLMTPTLGVWAMSVTAKVLRMNTTRYVAAAFISITVWAVVILIALRAGISIAS